jgi:hypothetical protein
MLMENQKGSHVHLDGTQRAQVGLEDILQAFTSVDVHFQSFTPPLSIY